MTSYDEQPVLGAVGLQKHYGPTAALAGVNLSIARGQSLAIMGPSGSGKTTLLHVLAGMIVPDAGRMLLDASGAGATDVTALPESGRTALRREVFGFVFQQGLLLPELSAVDNVAMAAMLRGASRSAATAMAGDWLARVGLAEHADKRIGQLSGGQAQRVAIARAQVTDPAVVFADEPTGALDQETGQQVLGLLQHSTVGRGRTLVMVTHDEHVAATCSRIVRLRDGRIIADSAGYAGGPGNVTDVPQPPQPPQRPAAPPALQPVPHVVAPTRFYAPAQPSTPARFYAPAPAAPTRVVRR